MSEYKTILDFIEWTHIKCFTLEGLVLEDIKRMIRMYLKEREQ